MLKFFITAVVLAVIAIVSFFIIIFKKKIELVPVAALCLVGAMIFMGSYVTINSYNCPKCEQKVSYEDTFCGNCGYLLSADSEKEIKEKISSSFICETCGTSYERKQRKNLNFCTTCGKSFKEDE